jgi:CubicO group peptidase (beta-lactamase class C family)
VVVANPFSRRIAIAFVLALAASSCVGSSKPGTTSHVNLSACTVQGVAARSFACPIVPFGSSSQVGAADPATSVIAKYRTLIPELMAEQRIPGLAVALVSADQALWVEGFGHLDGPNSAPVTADTIFSVQSMSKLFTATAVMQAVAAGRLDLGIEPVVLFPGIEADASGRSDLP